VKYLFDTDHITFLQWRSGPEYAAIAARMSQFTAADFAVSIVSFHEQVLGGHALINRPRKATDVIYGYSLLLEVLQSYGKRVVLSFDAAAEAVFSGLNAQKIRVGTMDLRIAAIALSCGLVLPTRNQRDFGRIAGLLTEDWTI
jgi:tRNA(fMet)-specific endonuclease VapC